MKIYGIHEKQLQIDENPCKYITLFDNPWKSMLPMPLVWRILLLRGLGILGNSGSQFLLKKTIVRKFSFHFVLLVIY